MNVDALFMKGTRAKIRFETSKGLLTIEDLWDLGRQPLASTTGKLCLNSIAVDLHQQLEARGRKSFVDDVAEVDQELKQKLDLVVSIIDEIKAERKAAAEIRDIREKYERNNAALASKEEEKRSARTIEEILAEQATLKAQLEAKTA